MKNLQKRAVSSCLTTSNVPQNEKMCLTFINLGCSLRNLAGIFLPFSKKPGGQL